MPFGFSPARREKISLLIALAGASGSGKTLSALRLARGLAGGDDSKIAIIDTEAGRALHYAIAEGEEVGADRFAFQHGDLRPPFSPEAYAEAIRQAETHNFEVIIVDSVSHEYEGEGGLHEMHDANVDHAVKVARDLSRQNNWRFDERLVREKSNIGAWNEPKRRHKAFVNRLLQSRAHLIVCLRAEEKIRIEKVFDEKTKRERTVIIQAKDLPPQERWVPICEKRFMYEMTISFVLSPLAPGVPIPIKLQSQHKSAVPLDKPLSEFTGQALAEWATGKKIAASSQPVLATEAAVASSPPSSSPHEGNTDGGDSDLWDTTTGEVMDESEIIAGYDQTLAIAASQGSAALKTEWEAIPNKYRKTLTSALRNRYKPIAAQADLQRTTADEPPAPA